MKQILTDGGMSLILRGLTGSRIEFTKIKFGNGEEQDKTAVDLGNPLLECPITSIARDTNFITLGTSYMNADVQVEFSAYETGVFAKDPDDETKDILYCLWYEDDPVKADYISPVDDKILETKIEFLVFVDNVEDVTAIISASMEYASKPALDNHINDNENPHKVDAKAVGLGNVSNVTPENQQPVFSNTVTAVTTENDGTKSLPNIQNGDVMGSILQKIRSAISAFISHLNAKNPHGLGASDVGAAASTHYHSASDINKGTLSLLRGGTGGTTAEEARTNIGAAPANHGHSYNDLSNKPAIPAAYSHPASHPASMITGLAAVATSGSYNDLSNKPAIPTIPASLPANGGNADTIDGKKASDFAPSVHDHKYAGSSSIGGAANSAVKLSTARKVTVNLASESGADFDGSKAITPGVSGILPITHGGTGAANADDARNNLGIITPEELPNLHIWKRFSSQPAVTSTSETNVRIAEVGAAEGADLFYSTEIIFGIGYAVVGDTIDMTFGKKISITSIEQANKYLKRAVDVQTWEGNTYHLTSNVTFSVKSEQVGSGYTSVTYYYLTASEATKREAPACLDMVASKDKNAYPLNGKHTDGYWYVYHKQLGE